MALLTYTHNFLTSLAFTCTVETLVLIVFVRLYLRRTTPISTLIFSGLFASFATITYVWYVFPVMVPKSVMPSVFLSEPFAFVVEAIFYRFVLRLSWAEALAASFLANTVSYLGGIGLRSAGLWVKW